MLAVTMADKAFRLIRIYGSNTTSELPDFFRRIELFVTSSKQVVLVGDWNTVHDPNLGRGWDLVGLLTI